MQKTLRHLHLVLEDDGTVRVSTGGYVEVQADGVDKPIGSKRLTGGELDTALPEKGALLLQIDGLIADKAELQSALDAVEAERDQLELELNPPRYLAKSVINERLAEAGLADAAWRELKADADLLAAWNEAGPEWLNVKDERVPAFIAALGADPDAILAT